MGGAISTMNPSASSRSTSPKAALIDLDSVDPSALMQTDKIEIEVIEQQSALFQQCIAEVTKKLCRELANLRANNKKLNDELEQQRKKSKKAAKNFKLLQTRYNKLQEDLEYQKSLVSHKSDKITRLESGFDLSKLGSIKRNNSFSIVADKVIKRKSNHEVSKTDLPPVLRGFTPVKKIQSVSTVIESIDLQNAENMFLKKPKSKIAMNALNKHVKTVYSKLKAAIAKRLRTPNILEDCRKVEESGNASFLQVYDAIWSTITENEAVGLAQYRETSSEVQITIKLTETGVVLCQRHKKCVPLLQDAAHIKPLFNETINDLLQNAQEQFEMREESLNIVEIQIPEQLKRVARILEKAAFRCDDIDNCDNTCDIVRGMIVCAHMDDVANVLSVLNTSAALIIVRMKERFEEAPTSGGWRDCMVNFYLKDDPNRHICELQLVHQRMLVARSSMPGHAVYSRLRNAIEIQEALYSFKMFGLSPQEAAIAGVSAARLDRALGRIQHVKDVMKKVQAAMDRTIKKRSSTDGKLKKLRRTASTYDLDDSMPQEYAKQLREMGVHTFNRPPAVLKAVMMGVLIILGVEDPKWEDVRPWLKRNKIRDALNNLDVSDVTQEQIEEMQQLFADANLRTQEQVKSKIQRFSNKYTVLLWLYDLLQKITNQAKMQQPLQDLQEKHAIVTTKQAKLNTILACLKRAVAFSQRLKANIDSSAKQIDIINKMESLLDDTVVAEKQFSESIANIPN